MEQLSSGTETSILKVYRAQAQGTENVVKYYRRICLLL
jgi:hypothetical protein